VTVKNYKRDKSVYPIWLAIGNKTAAQQNRKKMLHRNGTPLKQNEDGRTWPSQMYSANCLLKTSLYWNTMVSTATTVAK